MCYNYENHVEYQGSIINKYKLRLNERQQAIKAFADKYQFHYTTGFAHAELPVITSQNPDEVQFFKWGLIPHWIKTRKEAEAIRKQTLNAKAETIFTLPSFRSYIKSRRCLIPATAFFEWYTEGKNKYPYRIMVKDTIFPDSTREFCFGGIYSQWVDKEIGEVLDTFSMITVPANDLLARIHNTKQRMPLILLPEDEKQWLNPHLDEAGIKALMKPYPDELMCAYSISKRITGKEDRNVPELIEPYQYEGVEQFINGGSPMDWGFPHK